MSPGAHVRFNELYNKLPAEGFSSEEKTAVSNIRGCEREIETLEHFLKNENED